MCQTLLDSCTCHLIYLHKTLYNRNHNFSQCGQSLWQRLTHSVTEPRQVTEGDEPRNLDSRDWLQGTKRQKKARRCFSFEEVLEQRAVFQASGWWEWESRQEGRGGRTNSWVCAEGLGQRTVRVRREGWARWWDGTQLCIEDSWDQWKDEEDSL